MRTLTFQLILHIFNCAKCNYTHVYGACALQSLVNCAAISTKASKLCVQDISVNTGSRYRKGNSRPVKNARVLFDLGSQTSLVRDKFAE